MISIEKKQFILGIFILAFSLGLAGCFKQPVVNQNIDTNTNVNSNEIDTSDWQTYENKEYGFEFKYPKEWKIQINYGDLPSLTKYDCYLKDVYKYYSCIISEIDFGLFNIMPWAKDYFERGVADRKIYIIKKTDNFELLTDFNVFDQNFVHRSSFYLKTRGKIIEILWYPSEAAGDDYPLIYEAAKKEFVKFKAFLSSINEIKQ